MRQLRTVLEVSHPGQGEGNIFELQVLPERDLQSAARERLRIRTPQPQSVGKPGFAQENSRNRGLSEEPSGKPTCLRCL
jgi:hypothetical protein